MPKKKILFVTQVFGHMQLCLIKDLSSQYSVHVFKSISINRKYNVLKLFSYVFFTLHYFAYMLLFSRRFDLVIVNSNPPFSIFVNLFFPLPFVWIIYDIYPDAFVHTAGLKKSSLIYQLWLHLNVKIVSRSYQTVCLTAEMSHRLLRSCSHLSSKVSIISAWGDVHNLRQIELSHNKFLDLYAFEHDMLFLYSGNLGQSQPLSFIIDALPAIEEGIDLVFIGFGSQYDSLKNYSASFKHSCSSAIRFFPMFDYDMVSHTYSACTFSIIALEKHFSDLSIPSKLFTSLAVGKPILCIADHSSAAASLIRRYECGITIAPDDNFSENFKNFICLLRANPDYIRRLSKNALTASRSFSPALTSKYLDLLKDL